MVDELLVLFEEEVQSGNLAPDLLGVHWLQGELLSESFVPLSLLPIDPGIAECLLNAVQDGEQLGILL